MLNEENLVVIVVVVVGKPNGTRVTIAIEQTLVVQHAVGEIQIFIFIFLSFRSYYLLSLLPLIRSGSLLGNLLPRLILFLVALS